MNAVGIDVSKGKSMVAVARPLGEIVLPPYEVCHTANDLGKLARDLAKLEGETRVVMEHTGRYYEPVARMLQDAGIYVSAVNPLLIKQYGNNSIRKVKTDKADALKIARYGLDNWHELREHTSMETMRDQLKTMNRQLGLYSKTATAFKNNLIALLDQTYPGVNTYFDSAAREDGSQKWVDFASCFWHAECVRSLSLNAFAERYAKFCKRNGYYFSSAKAETIYKEARELVPLLAKDNVSKMLVQGAITQLNAISKAVKTLRAKMLDLAKQLPEYPVVMAMYGVGPSLGPQIIAEIGDVRRFEHRGALAAFAGVDPMPSQSGTHERQSDPTSKRGSPHLRKALFLVMEALLLNAPADDPVYQFLNKKRSEGKPFYVFMTAGANKFLRIYYGRVREYLAHLT